MGNKRKGLTLTELLVGVIVMMITLSVATISLTSTDQTPRREAERITAYLTRLTQKSDRVKVSFDFELSGNTLKVSWKEHGKNMEPDFMLSEACIYEPRLNTQEKNDKITIWTYDRSKYPDGVKIAAISGTSGSYMSGGSKRTYDYYKNKGHMYLKITNDNSGKIKGKNHSEYYVLITSQDLIK